MSYPIQKITRFSILIFFLFNFSISHANTLLRTADKFLQLDNYHEAITEYKRFIFFHPKNNKIGYAYHQIGLAYREMGEWDQALGALDKSIYFIKDDVTREEWMIDKAVILIASGNSSLAQQQLLNLYVFSNYPKIKQQALLFLILNCTYIYDWKGAQEYLQRYFEEFKGEIDTSFKEIEYLLNEAQILPYKSVKAAKYLSTIIPGSGQIYSENWFNGIDAFAINGTFGTICVDLFLRGYYVDSTIIFLFIFSRYYLGNRYQAEQSAINYNQKLDREQAQKILKSLSAFLNVPK